MKRLGLAVRRFRARRRLSESCAFGVAVKAKKLRLGCWERLAISRSMVSCQSSVSAAFLGGRFFCLLERCDPWPRTPFKSAAASPDWDEWASSTITAYLPVFNSSVFLRTNGNFCSVVMMMGVPFSERLGQLVGILIDLFRRRPVCARTRRWLSCNWRSSTMRSVMTTTRIEDPFDLRQSCRLDEAMREPGDGVALAASGRMLDQIVLARRHCARASASNWPHNLELVIARENQRILFSLSRPFRGEESGRECRASYRVTKTSSQR